MLVDIIDLEIWSLGQSADSALDDSQVGCLFNVTLGRNVCDSQSESFTCNKRGPVQLREDKTVLFAIVNISLAAVLSTSTFVFNGVLLLAYYLEKSLRHPSQLYIIENAICNVIYATSLPLAISRLLFGWHFGNVLCVYYFITQVCVEIMRMLTMVKLTVDRYLMVKLPQRFRAWRTKRKVLILMILNLAITFCPFTTSVLYWYFTQPSKLCKDYTCQLKYEPAAQKLVLFLFPIFFYYYPAAIIIVTYVLTLIYVRRQTREIRRSSTQLQTYLLPMSSTALTPTDRSFNHNASVPGTANGPPCAVEASAPPVVGSDTNKHNRNGVSTRKFTSDIYGQKSLNLSKVGGNGSPRFGAKLFSLFGRKKRAEENTRSDRNRNTNADNGTPDGNRQSSGCGSEVDSVVQPLTTMDDTPTHGVQKLPGLANVLAKRSRAEREGKRALRTIVLVSGSWVVLWFPYMSVIFALSHIPGPISNYPSLVISSYWVTQIGYAINPVLYAIAEISVRKTCLRIFRLDFRKNTRD